MFFVVRSNGSFNFPLGLIKYIVMLRKMILSKTPISQSTRNPKKTIIIITEMCKAPIPLFKALKKT